MPLKPSEQVENVRPLAEPVQYAKAHQKEEIIRLLNHPMITRQEKTKMLLNINRLDEARADLSIAKLRQAIVDREDGAPIPVAKPQGAAGEEFTFYQLHKCSQRELDMRERVYPFRVRDNKLSERKAEFETEVMRRITDIFWKLSNGDYALVDTNSRKEVLGSLPLPLKH